MLIQKKPRQVDCRLRRDAGIAINPDKLTSFGFALKMAINTSKYRIGIRCVVNDYATEFTATDNRKAGGKR